MPIKSKAQQRLMFAAAAGKAKTGVPKKVAKEMIEETEKEDYEDMPEREMSEDKAPKKKRIVVKKKKKNKGGK